MALPWLALWVGQRRWLPAAAAALLLLLSKENMALWLAFVLLGLAWQHRRQRAVAAGLGLAAGGALAYFWLITSYVMPGLDHAHRAFAQLVRYRHLGPSLPAAVAYVLAHPAALWAALLENTTGDPAHNYIKLELWAALLLSGGWALLRRPWYALMLLPIVGQKLLANDPGIWGINGQYSIEFAPVLALAVTDWLAARPPLPAGRRALAGPVAVAVTALFTIVTLYTRQSTWYDRTTTNFLLGRHYRCHYQRAALHAALARLPATVALSAQSCLVPQVPERPQLYLFPVVRDARYVAILRYPDEGSAWPLSLAASARAIEQLRARADFRVAYEDEQLLIFKRFGPVANAAEVLQP